MSSRKAAVPAWLAAAPPLPGILSWHRGLCGACGPEWLCDEYREIIAEYGAGPYGAAVFWPEGQA